jgi:hypothetical protein
MTIIIWGWYTRPVMAAVLSVLSLTPLRIIIKYLCTKEIWEYKWLLSDPGLFTSWKRPPVSSERLNSDAVAKCKALVCGESNPGRTACSLVSVPLYFLETTSSTH